MVLRHYPGWAAGRAGLLERLRRCFTYADGEDRATGYLYGAERPWPPQFAGHGAALLVALEELLGVRFAVCAFQAYRNGAGCGWHADTPFAEQAIVSLGVTRTFEWRPVGGVARALRLAAGDLVFMPAGFQDGHEHRVPEEVAPGERCSLVFRVPV